MVEPDALVIRLKAHIAGIQPPITRTLELPMDLNLAQLHEVLQATFGWTDSHLHQFDIGGLTYGAPEFDEDGWIDRQIFEATSVRLANFTIPYDAPVTVLYEYDFGDIWTHVLELTAKPREGGAKYPRCIAGARAAPPLGRRRNFWLRRLPRSVARSNARAAQKHATMGRSEV